MPLKYWVKGRMEAAAIRPFRKFTYNQIISHGQKPKPDHVLTASCIIAGKLL
jgi:hypothetical protein